MKIVIDLTSLSYHMSGIERYAACITEEMLNIDESNEYILIFRNEVYKLLKKFVKKSNVKTLILKGDNKLIFYQVILAKSLNKISADKYIFFAFTSPILFKHTGIINTVHDMGAWDCSYTMKLIQGIYFRITTKTSVRHSEKVITVSDFSKGRIHQLLKFPKNRIFVIPGGVSKTLLYSNKGNYKSVEEKYKLPKRYVLSLSTLEPRKNLTLLLNAYSEIVDQVDYDLVLVGRKGWKIDDTLDKLRAVSRIHLTGFVEDEDVTHIYRHAICFVFPSIYEGFGLPPLEALSLGTPVIASNVSSIPEILQDQAMYFDNNSLSGLKKSLLLLTQKDVNLPKELNPFQKENYQFENSAKRLLKVINE